MFESTEGGKMREGVHPTKFRTSGVDAERVAQNQAAWILGADLERLKPLQRSFPLYKD